MPKTPKKEATDVRIANISARQAILVALITAIAGLIGSFISYSQGLRHSPSHRYLKIASLDSRFTKGAVRIVADVNGQPYSYPSRAVWADLGHEQPSEAFLLPPDQSEIIVHFSAFFRDASGEVRQLTSADSARIAASALPIVDKVSLYGIKVATFSGTGDSPLVINYEIR